jgi:hypothetical protein
MGLIDFTNLIDFRLLRLFVIGMFFAFETMLFHFQFFFNLLFVPLGEIIHRLTNLAFHLD